MNISATARRGVLASASNTFRGARARSASSAAGAGIPAPGLDRAGHIAAGPIRPATRRRSATTEYYRRPRRRSQLYHRSESDSPGHARITAWNPTHQDRYLRIDPRRRRTCRLYRLVKRSGRPPWQPATQPASQPRINPSGATAPDCWPHPVDLFQNAMNPPDTLKEPALCSSAASDHHIRR
jgi:hypothetical protein